MHRTGIRIIIATLVAAFAVVVVIAPVASGGSAPSGALGGIATVSSGGSGTIDSKKKDQQKAAAAKAQLCADLQLIWEGAAEASEERAKAGQSPDATVDGNNPAQTMIEVTSDMRKVGC